MGYHTNPWLSTAFQNTANPNMDYKSFLSGEGVDVDPSKVGQFFGGITKDYQQDIGMARAGLSQTMGQGRMMGEQAMFGLGGGSGISSGFGGGFGRQGYGIMQGIGGINKQYGQTLASGLLGYTGDLQSAQRGMQSSFRDVAAGLLGRDAEGISYSDPTTTTYTDPRGDPPNGWGDWTSYDNWINSGADWNERENYGWLQTAEVCFLSGTKVDIIDGNISIEDLQIGDEVKTYDLKNKNHKKSKVTETYKHNIDGYLIINDIIKTTPNHPFYSDDKWIPAGQLSIGDKILHVDGAEHKISSIEKFNDNVDVYNIEVDGTHNYFAEGYLVHNKG
jgi:hypothetical protein